MMGQFLHPISLQLDRGNSALGPEKCPDDQESNLDYICSKERENGLTKFKFHHFHLDLLLIGILLFEKTN